MRRWGALVLLGISFAAPAARAATASEISEWMEGLRADEPATAQAASDALVKIGRPAVSPLRLALEDQNFILRRRAAETLGRLGPEAASAASVLVETLFDPQPDVHAAAEDALLKIGDAAFPALVHGLSLKGSSERQMIIDLLPRFGARANTPLIHVLRKDPDPYVKARAASALAGLRPVDTGAVSALIDALKNNDESVRRNAVLALGDLGSEARAAIPALTVLSQNDPDSLVQVRATQAVATIQAALNPPAVSTTTPATPGGK
jgi:HEAT repeat protein